METRKYLVALDEVVSKRYPHTMYHIGGYQEASICLQSQTNGWIVYNGEHGNHYDEVFCDTLLEACLEFIRKLTHCVEDISEMKNELLVTITQLDIPLSTDTPNPETVKAMKDADEGNTASFSSIEKLMENLYD